MVDDPRSLSPDRSDDQVLIGRVHAQQDGAFAELVHTYTRKVYSIAISMLRNEQDARDVVQETFLNVHRRLHTFRGDASLSSWIGRIATNNALMKLRTRRRKPETSLEVRVPGQPVSERTERVIIDKQPIAEKLSLNRELGERIRACVDELPEKYREVLILSDYREMPMRDIAEALDITVPNVKTRLHRARLRVRQALADYLNGRE